MTGVDPGSRGVARIEVCVCVCVCVCVSERERERDQLRSVLAVQYYRCKFSINSKYTVYSDCNLYVLSGGSLYRKEQTTYQYFSEETVHNCLLLNTM